MFEPINEPGQGLFFIEKDASRISTAIHTLFMNFDITTIWLDPSLKVIDLTIAKKWRLGYFPKVPAKYIIETHTSHIFEYKNGDQIEIRKSDN